MKFGNARFYADENIEDDLVVWLRAKGFRVDSASQLGLTPRDDKFHLQEAKRRRAVLLTRDFDYLNHRRFPFRDLNDTSIVVLRTVDQGTNKAQYGYMLMCLVKEIAASGVENLTGYKIELTGPRMVLHARIRGRIRTDLVDISKPWATRELFTD